MYSQILPKSEHSARKEHKEEEEVLGKKYQDTRQARSTMMTFEIFGEARRAPR